MTYRPLRRSVFGAIAFIASAYERLRASQSFFKEAVVWKRLNHPNIIPFIGVTTSPLQMISDWVRNVTLMEFIEGAPGVTRISLVSVFL